MFITFIKRSALLWIAIALVFPGVYLVSSSKATAATAPCGSGDHGLLGDLQKQHAGESENPLQFADIQFLNENTGRAAGNGFMIGTSDAGCHWQELNSGEWDFTQIDFPNNKDGWALASMPTKQTKVLIQTSDGGSHWSKVSTGSVSFARMDRISETVGFGYTRTSAYKTLDAGSRFVKISTPANSRYMSFNDVNHGWALVVIPGGGYKVMKTIDGGKNWSNKLNVAAESNTGGEIYSNGKQVWALLYGEYGMSQVSYSLYSSIDGGGHWNHVISQSTAGGGPAPGGGKAVVDKGPAQSGGHPSNMQLIDGNTAFLGAGSPAGEVVSVGRTYDGGKTWRNMTPSISGYDARISFTDRKRGWMTATGDTKSAIYMTRDGGLSWNRKFTLQ
ncbi:photosystem II stability/assembly factor-like uncharacterized protein [Paenibacillus sp. DS2015]|uniref:WD40/YVTN/BNR-like repeat-containing protein n=1 Tax=Paenibacillus sp. DS2015 TaxID=3373917 RepID=UPI003D1A3CA7